MARGLRVLGVSSEELSLTISTPMWDSSQLPGTLTSTCLHTDTSIKFKSKYIKKAIV